MSRRWTTSEVNYLAAHATEGAEAIASRLGRSIKSVKSMASNYGISLQVRYYCPRCCRYVLTPLSPHSGWCRTCSIEESHDNAAQKNCDVRRELEAERIRIREAERRRQKVYSDTDKRKNELKRLRKQNP